MGAASISNPNTVQFKIEQPFPGTELYEIAKREGQVSADFSDYRWYGSIKYLPAGMTREQLLKLYGRRTGDSTSGRASS